MAHEYLESYSLRHRSTIFAEYAVKHLTRLLGHEMIVDINEKTIREYQDARLREKGSPKTINEEVGVLLRIMGERGDLVRARLKKGKTLKLKVRPYVAMIFSPEEKQQLIDAARGAKSPCIYPALMLATNTAMRNSEIRTLQWKQADFGRRFLTVGRTKTDAGEGRTIPLNSAPYDALTGRAEWYKLRFGRIEPEWHLFPFGHLHRLDPARPITTLKTSWTNVRRHTGVNGRLHDARHTLITELAESGAGDETIMDIAGHVSRQMLRRYSHIRMRAKREALEAALQKQQATPKKEEMEQAQPCPPVVAGSTAAEGESLQNPLYRLQKPGQKGCQYVSKLLKKMAPRAGLEPVRQPTD